MTAYGTDGVRQRIRLYEGSPYEVELSWSALSDIGRRRESNQDSYVAVPPVFAVADGMGGHSAGEIASAAAARRLSEFSTQRLVNDRNIEDALIDAVDDIEVNAGDTELGAGTTVTGVAFGADPNAACWRVFNIGDSRVYELADGRLTQLTVDHSVVQHLLDTGAITEEEAEYHPHANVITRALGFNEPPSPDFSSLPMKSGQRLLLCSDGLTKELTEAGIRHFLGAETVAEAARLLVQSALDNSGRDNVTVVVIEVHEILDA